MSDIQRQRDLHAALDDMVKAVTQAQGLAGSRESILLAWKRDFIMRVEPSGRRDIYRDAQMIQTIIDKLKTVINERPRAQSFLKFDDYERVWKVNPEYVLATFLSCLNEAGAVTLLSERIRTSTNERRFADFSLISFPLAPQLPNLAPTSSN